MKPKTLKDIPFEQEHFIIEQVPSTKTNILGIEELEKNAVSKISLRKEAIKEIKLLQKIGTTTQYEEYKKLSPLLQSFYESDDDAVWCCDNLINYIKWKFNITEEDLK